jgi:hypothetical protein
MIDYEYTAVNRLNTPHKYMYSLYQGDEFLDSYFKNRLENLKRLKRIKKENYKNKVHLFLYSEASISLKKFLDRELSASLKETINSNEVIKLDEAYSDQKVKVLPSFNISNKVNSEDLLISLINNQINKKDKELIKFWLDLLIQRFEVTKKIYKNYQVGFRKGEGGNDNVQLYWMFALSLVLYFHATKKIKYLNTLLKVSDLLCSLDDKSLSQSIPSQGLSLVLLFELLSIKFLSKTIDEAENEFA